MESKSWSKLHKTSNYDQVILMIELPLKRDV